MKAVGVVYGLFEPCGDLPFYIGLTTQKHPQNRLSEHIYDAKNMRGKNVYKENLIRKLIRVGARPEFKILEDVFGSVDDLKDREKFWIAKYSPRTNKTAGGDWNPLLSPIRAQTLQKIKISRTKKREKAAAALGVSVEELIARRKQSYLVTKAVWARNHPEKFREYTKQYRKRLRNTMGDVAYKELVAKQSRDRYAKRMRLRFKSKVELQPAPGSSTNSLTGDTGLV